MSARLAILAMLVAPLAGCAKKPAEPPAAAPQSIYRAIAQADLDLRAAQQKQAGGSNQPAAKGSGAGR
ncbi:MAG TPA: hypothetical protein VF628_03675 [Allosphingosinicella sp.]|jgi:hypothetical protein